MQFLIKTTLTFKFNLKNKSLSPFKNFV